MPLAGFIFKFESDYSFERDYGELTTYSSYSLRKESVNRDLFNKPFNASDYKIISYKDEYGNYKLISVRKRP